MLISFFSTIKHLLLLSLRLFVDTCEMTALALRFFSSKHVVLTHKCSTNNRSLHNIYVIWHSHNRRMAVQLHCQVTNSLVTSELNTESSSFSIDTEMCVSIG